MITSDHPYVGILDLVLYVTYLIHINVPLWGLSLRTWQSKSQHLIFLPTLCKQQEPRTAVSKNGPASGSSRHDSATREKPGRPRSSFVPPTRTQVGYLTEFQAT